MRRERLTQHNTQLTCLFQPLSRVTNSVNPRGDLGSTGLEWRTSSPPPPDNFPETPVVTEDPYIYSQEEAHVVG